MAGIINSLERATTVVNLVDNLRSKIINQEYQSGEAVTESALAQEFGISRGSVRTALQALENEGIIVTLPNGRKQVMGINEKYLDDLYNTRKVIECEAARQILSMKQVDFSEMAGFVSKFREIASAEQEVMRDERTRVNMQFHRSLIGMSRNRPLFKCWNTIEPMIGALIKFNSDTLIVETHIDDYVVSHSKILEMFLAQDPDVIDYLVYHTYDAPHRDTLKGLKSKGCL